jgi:two-component system, NarL family, nitrate/nitrite response regulator NarL
VNSIGKPRYSNIDTVVDAAECGAIRIAVFDDNPLFRAGIVHVLNAEPGMEVVAEGSSGSNTPRLGAKLSLDIAVLDSDLMTADRNLWRSIIGLRPDVKILVMAFNPDQEQVLAAFAAGAQGYILKGVSGHELLEAVRALHRSEGYVSPALAATMLANVSLAGRAKGANANPQAQLTFREEQIFNLLSAGLKNREIGRRIGVTEKTVKRYVTRIFEKLHVRNRVEAAMLSKPGAKLPFVPRRRRVVIALPTIELATKTDSPPGAEAVAGLPGRANGKLPPRGNGQVPSG